MVYFVTCVKHPDNSHSYEDTWKLLQNTLHSVCNQTDDNFQVLVMCNKVLDDFKDDNKIINTRFIELDWDAPTTNNKWQVGKHEGVDYDETMDNIIKDRGSKYTLALYELAKLNPSSDDYVMFFDADDFLSPHISEFLNLNPFHDVWAINYGYVLFQDENQNLIVSNSRSDRPIAQSFHQICGSSVIFKLDLLFEGINQDLIQDIDKTTPQEKIIESIDSFIFYNILAVHHSSVAYYIQQNKSVGVIPFYAAVYNLTHNENHSGNKNTNFIHPGILTDKHSGYHVFPNFLKELFSIKLLSGKRTEFPFNSIENGGRT